MVESAGTNATLPQPPAYGRRSLPDVLPSLLAALGVQDAAGPLDVPAARGVCLLLVDGLGWEQLREHKDDAPFLAGLAGLAGVGGGALPLEVGFPATTATSITSLGTGRPPGEHGIVGYTFAADGRSTLLNALSWRAHASRRQRDLLHRHPPEHVQPHATAFETAAAAGVRVRVLAQPVQGGSGLSRAALRGGEFRAVHAFGDLAADAVDALQGPGPALCYAYHGDLDLIGHLRAPGSAAWRLQLAHVDALAAEIAARLPGDCRLAVTADHGMIAVDRDELVDADTDAALQEGVRLLGGDVRARHVYVRAGALNDVVAAWRDRLGERAWVVPRDEAITAGWFGPQVADAVRPRIGDVIVAARGLGGVIASKAEARISRMLGHHGSFSPAEQRVPFLLAP